MANKKDINAVRTALRDCKEFLDMMEYPEFQGAGLAIAGSLGYEFDATDEDGTEFTSENIYEALEKFVDKSENGTEEEFAEAYTKTILAAHILFSIHEYHKFLLWWTENDEMENGEEDESSDENPLHEKED